MAMERHGEVFFVVNISEQGYIRKRRIHAITMLMADGRRHLIAGKHLPDEIVLQVGGTESGKHILELFLPEEWRRRQSWTRRWTPVLNRKSWFVGLTIAIWFWLTLTVILDR